MDKRVMLAVAGSGKTSYIIKSLSLDKRSLIITYTNNNYANLYSRVLKKFNDVWPDNISLMTYERFLFGFCYKPFLADVCNARKLSFQRPQNNRISKNSRGFYITSDNHLYYNRLATLVEENVMDDVEERLLKYFDEFILDEVQDIAGRDFSLLEAIMKIPMNMLFVGDFYQHTFDTSRDGMVNGNLHSDYEKYKSRFSKCGVTVDTDRLINSWRCSGKICKFVSDKLGVQMGSNRKDDTDIIFIKDKKIADKIKEDKNIVKLCYNKSYDFGEDYRNWGDAKGEDCYNDVCVVLNKNTFSKYRNDRLNELTPSTRNKLYVAITRAHGNVYLIEG